MTKRDKQLYTYLRAHYRMIISSLLILLGIMISLLLPDILLRNRIGLEIKTSWSPLLFTLSWIFLLIGIMIFLKKRTRMILYGVTVGFTNIIVILQDLFLNGQGEMSQVESFLTIFKIKDFTIHGDIIIGSIISLAIMGITLVLLKKQEEYHMDRYQKIYSLLITIILVGFCKGSATTLLGPEMISKTEKRVDPNLFEKNTYLARQDITKTMKLSGVYEETYRSICEWLSKEYEKRNLEE